MKFVLDNESVRKIIGDILIDDKINGDMIHSFLKAINEMQNDYFYSSDKGDFMSYSIKSMLFGKNVTLFKKVMKELGYECKFNSHGDCFYTYVGK